VDAAAFETSCTSLVSAVDHDLRQTFSALYAGFLKSIDFSSQDISSKALKKFNKFAEQIRVNPSLMPLLIIMPDNTFFEDWFIQKLCSSCLILRVKKDPLTDAKFVIPSSFTEDLSRVLGPLLGTSFLSTNVDEFNLKHSLKIRLINAAVSTI
jgi:hypothetical protein